MRSQSSPHPDKLCHQGSFFPSAFVRDSFIFTNQLISPKRPRPLSLFPIKMVMMKSLSHVQLFATSWTVADQASPFMGFSRQEYWSGLPFPSPGDLSHPGMEQRSPALKADALPSKPPGISFYFLPFFFPPSFLHSLLPSLSSFFYFFQFISPRAIQLKSKGYVAILNHYTVAILNSKFATLQCGKLKLTDSRIRLDVICGFYSSVMCYNFFDLWIYQWKFRSRIFEQGKLVAFSKT